MPFSVNCLGRYFQFLHSRRSTKKKKPQPEKADSHLTQKKTLYPLTLVSTDYDSYITSLVTWYRH